MKSALANTLKNIREKLNGFPTILWSGNGYHIIQPVYCPTTLENIIEFNGFDRPSEQFLRFAKDYLSNGKADKNNNPSFRSCLLRIPESTNSKYDIKVKIIQKWNGYRPPIPREFVEEFRTYLIQKKIKKNNNRYTNNKNKNDYVPYYEWIENLLQTPIHECRKNVLWRILCPYLVNIRKLSYEESISILRAWLDKCNSESGTKLDFDPNQKIKYELRQVGSYLPPRVQKIKTDNEYTDLYQILKNKGVII